MGIFFMVLGVFCLLLVALRVVNFLRSGEYTHFEAILQGVKEAAVIFLLGAILISLKGYADTLLEENSRQISIMEAQETVTICDKRIGNGLFRISYYVTCSFTDSETGTEYTREVPVTEEQYNLLKIGDEWDYAHR